MVLALTLARRASACGEVPVGAVVLDRDHRLLAQGHNRVESRHSTLAHAEILVIWQATRRLRSKFLTGCHLVVTLEPCPLCAQAIADSRIAHLTFAAPDPKGGGVIHGAKIFDQENCRHRPKVIAGRRESEAADLLRVFFQNRR